MKKKTQQFWLLVFLVTICINHEVVAQAYDARIKNIEAAYPAIDEVFSNYARQNHFPGFVYGLLVDGKLVHTGNIGYLNTTQKNAADSKSAFRIASMTKSFTAMAILKLRDEGKLKLDDPVYLYIPEMKGQRYLTTDAAPITIRHLLTHGAGFPEDNPWGDRQLATTDKELVDLIKKGISFSNDPGLGYEYSNLGFAMLGFVIKKVSGQPYQTYITKNILEPLGMVHTYWEYSKVPANTLAHGYRWLNEQWVEQPLLHDGTYGAMGGMITTIEDFSRYVILQLSAWPPRNDEDKGPVKRSSLREMQFPWNISGFNPQFKYPGGRPCPLVTAYAYGLGWTRDCEDRIYIGHTGGLPGFGSNWKIMPDYGIGIISFSNLTYAPTSSINLQVLDTLISLAKLQPKKIPVSAILDQRKNELIKLLPEWKQAESIPVFAENFFMDYFTDSLRKEAVEIFSRAGKIIHIRELIPENNLRGSFIMEGENSNIEISFTLTPENPPLIQEYHIQEIKK
ncbi:serine hydrolase domain-containing protein [Flavihumibacter profundi]|uniref:serine hydrolase domain-containing protein n=1 Tax=Flavihumibacter profundi TaxID=2716883 RepID=UPI001CC6A0E9|nr:serine hydrolase domain-containing protein [Flavihumibacter profundi]MBZ5856829.1 beta-lactamase family protein [Flavihumibacter profundi]